MNQTFEYIVSINGLPIPEISGKIVEIVVDLDCFMPAMFTIIFHDSVETPAFPVFTLTDDQLLFRIGAAISITVITTASATHIPTENLLFMGEITSVEPNFRDDGQVDLRIRGYDYGHRLTLGKNTRSWGIGFEPTVNEAEIIGQIAESNGLIPVFEIPTLAEVFYSSIIQYNQSDWDFLWSRARLFGYQVYVQERMLYFTPAQVPRWLVPVELGWGQNMISFKPRFVADGGVVDTIANGYDPDLKIPMEAPSIPGIGELDPTTSPLAAQEPTGSMAGMEGFQSRAMDRIVHPMIKNPIIAELLANARFLQHESHYVRASGVAVGNPNLVAGSMATVLNVGERFSGEYYVTSARHIIRSGDYRVEFEVSGRNPFTLGHFTGQDPQESRVYGAVVGIVTDIADPEFLGRVKVMYPWMPSSNFVPINSGMARQAIQGGGRGSGIYWSPSISDEVLVVFEQGDVNQPYIVGVLWNDLDRPPVSLPGQAVLEGFVGQHMMKSRMGHTIILDDTPGEEKITIKDAVGNSIEINTIEEEIPIMAVGNINFECAGVFSVKAAGGITMVTEAEVSIEAAASISLVTEGEATIEAGPSGLTITDASINMEAPEVSIEAEAAVSVAAAGTVTLEAPMIMLN